MLSHESLNVPGPRFELRMFLVYIAVRCANNLELGLDPLSNALLRLSYASPQQSYVSPQQSYSSPQLSSASTKPDIVTP